MRFQAAYTVLLKVRGLDKRGSCEGSWEGPTEMEARARAQAHMHALKKRERKKAANKAGKA